MQLHTLLVRNLNSLKGDHFIDFKMGPLAETGLFAITGPTGAGKSTLLDAITLALYNRTPRTGAVSKNDIIKLGSLITRNTDDAKAEVQFQVNGKIYLSQWGISRARTGNLRDYEMHLSVQNETGDFVELDLKKGEVPDKNAELIGLNFDQFLRSILLSQGDFARFLKSNANERGELLEKITGTDIYRTIGKAAYEKQKAELQRLLDIQRELEGIELLPVEDKQQLEAEIKQLEVSVLQLKEQSKQLNAHLLLLRRLKETEHLLKQKQAQQQELQLKMDAFEADKLKIDFHQRLLPLKSDIDAARKGETDLLLLQKEIADYGQQQQKIEQQIAINAKELDSTNTALTTSQQALDKLLPLLEQVRVLDTAIREQTNRYTDKQKQYKEETERIQQVETTRKKQQSHYESVQKELSTLSVYLNAHAPFERLLEELPLLKQQHETVRSSEQLLQESVEQMDGSETKKALQKQPSIAHRLIILKEAVAKSDEWLAANRSKVMIQSQEVEGKTRELETLVNQRPVLERVLELSVSYQQLLQTAKAYETEEAELTELLSKNESALKLQDEAGILLEAQLKEWRVRMERQQLEMKYEEARKQLKAGEPCFLCGATTHPYVTHYEGGLDQSREMVLHKEKELKQQEKEKLRLVSLVEQTRSIIANSRRNQAQLQEQKSTLQSQLDQINRQHGWVFTLPDSSAVQAFIRSHQTAEVALKSALTLYSQVEKASALHKEFVRLLKMVESTITLHEQLTQALSVYKNYCGDASELWEQLKYLQSRLTLFVDKRDSRHKLEKEQEGLRVAVESLDKQVLEKKALAAVVKEGLVGLQNQLMALTKQRQDLFGDQSVQSTEEHARKQLKSSEEQLQSGLLEQKQLTARREALEVNIVKEKEAFTTLHANQQLLQEQLRTQLAKLGFPTIEQAAAHILSEETHQHLTEQWELLKNSQTSIRQSVNDLTAQYTGLTKEKQSDQSESELNTSIFGQDQQITAQGQRIGIITERLHRDQENTRKLADKIKGKEQQEMEYHRWKQLSDLIGDATGNTFSKFAQELTLQQVMRLANEHLKRLSDRYLIKHVKQENMDELFIVDTYHGNAERSVKTLSGGESFLVSLSLALGLSDLAGKNTLIGSLFIDEGFGTLDQNTLDVALSSLEKLQNETNRTIGIISHVPALKERVTTQIELVKDASGYSTLVIRS